MISSVEMKSGYAAELPNLKGRKFEFDPDCNVLYGPNGSGKTTILKVAAGHTGIETRHKQDGGGWSRSRNNSLYGKTEYQFPRDFKEITTGGVEADLVWDGRPCFYNSASLSEGSANLSYFVSDEEGSPDGMMSMMEQVALITGHWSEGELRQHKIGKLVKTLQKPPVWPPELKDHSTEAEKAFVEYVKGLLPKDKTAMTLLWDEPDRSLSVENQINFWTRFVPTLMDGLGIQMIIATHSYIPMVLPPFKFMRLIDVEEGYHAKSKKAFFSLLSVSLEVTEKAKKAEEKPEPAKPPEAPKKKRMPVPRKKK